jgi:cell wall-associated NlpC family hydrolase
MRKYFYQFGLLFVLMALFSSCSASKSRLQTKRESRLSSGKLIPTTPPVTKISTASPEELPEDIRVYNITSFALDQKGTRYKYGGTTKKGMDCSGLIYTSYLQENISLPRTSRGMSLKGDRLKLAEVNIGDLLFFETNKNKKVINHVGLVIEIQPGHIFFIHSTTSRGVIISSLADGYWFDHFVMARRLI